MCNKTIILVVFVIFDWSNLINVTIGNGQLDRQESESAKILKSDHFFYFFLNFKVLKAKKPTCRRSRILLRNYFYFGRKIVSIYFLNYVLCQFRPVDTEFVNIFAIGIFFLFFLALKTLHDKFIVKY